MVCIFAVCIYVYVNVSLTMPALRKSTKATAANPAQAADDLRNGTVGGFGLKGAQSAAISTQVAEAVQGAPVQPFVAADEEGGTVQRLAAALGRLPSQTTFGKGTVEAAQEAYRRHDAGMKDLGFNMTFAPVADVGSGSGLGSRTFGTDPATVSQFVVASVDVAEESGLIPVVKHWPGIGGGTAEVLRNVVAGALLKKKLPQTRDGWDKA